MARLSALPAALALAAAAALTLAACGGSDNPKLLPGATASQIDSNLSQVEQLVDESECIGAANSAAEIESQVEGLRGVDPKLKQALAEGATRLNENVAAECEEPSEEETAPAIETAEEAAPDEKPKHEKPEKSKEEAEQPGEANEGPTAPPPSNGKGEEKGHSEEAPPAETGEGPEPPSGGVGPGTAVEGE